MMEESGLRKDLALFALKLIFDFLCALAARLGAECWTVVYTMCSRGERMKSSIPGQIDTIFFWENH